MTGYDIYTKALLRLGYPDGQDGNNQKRQLKPALEYTKIICNDLNLPLIKDLSEEINFTNDQTEALCCGLCMHISRSEGDKTKCDLYTTVYNCNRARVLYKALMVKDTLPRVVDGGQ